MGHIHIGHYIFFLSKNTKVFQWLSKSKFLSFMTKVNPNNGNETKSEICPWGTVKSDIIFHWSQNTKIFQLLLQLALFNFIAKVSTNKYSEIKLHGTCANLTVFFVISKVVHYLNDF